MPLTIVITYPFSLGVAGGSPLDCAQTAIHLRRCGARVIVLPVSASGETLYPRPEAEALPAQRAQQELEAAGVEVVPVPQHGWHYQLDGRLVRRAVLEILKRERVDIVLSWSHEAAFLPRMLRSRGVRFGVIAVAPYTWELQSHQPGPGVRELMTKPRNGKSALSLAGNFAYRAAVRNPLGRMAGRWRRKLTLDGPLQKADVIFARSACTQDELIRLFGIDPQNITVAPCGVSERFSQIPRPSTSEIKHLIFSGWLTPQKGFYDTLWALGLLARAGQTNWRLRIAGWGDEQEVRRVVAEEGISDSIELLGRIDQPALCEQLAWADLAVLPSHFESFGLAIAEAQAAGLPVVSCRAGAIPEVVIDGITGWLVPPYHPEQLAEAIAAALADPAETCARGLAGRKRVTTKFTWERCAEIMHSRLEELCQVRSSA